MAAVNSSKMRNWRVRDAVAEDISDILQMIKVRTTNTTKKPRKRLYYGGFSQLL